MARQPSTRLPSLRIPQPPCGRSGPAVPLSVCSAQPPLNAAWAGPPAGTGARLTLQNPCRYSSPPWALQSGSYSQGSCSWPCREPGRQPEQLDACQPLPQWAPGGRGWFPCRILQPWQSQRWESAWGCHGAHAPSGGRVTARAPASHPGPSPL